MYYGAGELGIEVRMRQDELKNVWQLDIWLWAWSEAALLTGRITRYLGMSVSSLFTHHPYTCPGA